ncbi:hypothetical protein PGT21_032198 [Puccinia graminis f. sp. tritici]|uniref:Uncharacterized protein n=1 Tax=Puccinia graminis f. sp. tritici TaxID=56615 RepID=A0A5B0R3W4_PUCGR|nr:hypothetical protein PGT21_032198 [Puccinia graminis f. sp. tritici]
MEANEGSRRAEKRVRGIAGKRVLAEHCDKYSRGIQSFIKFFLGNPKRPQDYPSAPTPDELKALYWVERRAESIKQNLSRLREKLQGKAPAEVEFCVSQAEKEIRKNIKMPPFTPVVQIGPHKGQPVSAQTKGDVERSLALAGISRLTFDWDVSHISESPWNSAVVEVLGSRAVEWLRRSTPITDEQACQASAIILRWVHTKSGEIRDATNMGSEAYDQMKKGRTTKAQYERWRKKIRENRCAMAGKVLRGNINLAHICEDKDCGSDVEDGPNDSLPVTLSPNWRSGSLTSILHCFDKMVQAQATHHQTIKNNLLVYGRSQRLFKTFTGIRGVPRGLPCDCYEDAWWAKLSPYEQQTISQASTIGLGDIAKNLEKHCLGTTITTGTNAPTGSSTQNNNKRRLDETSLTGGQGEASQEGPRTTTGETMNVD